MRQLFCLLVLLSSFTFGHTQVRTPEAKLNKVKDTAYVGMLLQNAAKAWKKDKEQALALCTKAYELSLELNYQIGCFKALYNRASLKRRVSINTSAVEDYKAALAYSQKADSVDLTAMVYQALMETYFDMRLTDSALLAHTQLLKLSEQAGLKKSLFYSYFTMAGFISRQDSSLGRKYYFEALKIARAEKDPELLVEVLTTIAKLYIDIKPLADVNQFANEALWIANNSGDEYLLGLALTTKATVGYYYNQLDSTIFYGRKAYNLSKSLKSTNNRIYALTLMADGYEALQDYNSQLYYLKKAYELTQEYPMLTFKIGICQKLANAYKRMNQDDQAFEYVTLFAALKDSFYSEQGIRAREEFGIKYKVVESEKLVAENKLKVSEKEVQLQKSKRYTWYSISAASIAILVAILFFLNYKHKKKAHRQQLQSLEKEKEIQLLQALMQGEEKERSRIAKDLHDGVAGMLAAAKLQLGSLSLKHTDVVDSKEYQQAVKLLDDSTQEVRMTSHNLMPEVLMQHGLNEALRRYCVNISTDNLLKVRYEALGEVGRYIDTFELSVYRIVQELLNNVVKHSRATEAVVQLSVQEDKLCIMIEDNGVGFKDGLNQGGMGLRSLAARVKAMKGYFELDAQPNNGVTAYIEFSVVGLEKKSLKKTIKL